jgi:hypothetical protein
MTNAPRLAAAALVLLGTACSGGVRRVAPSPAPATTQVTSPATTPTATAPELIELSWCPGVGDASPEPLPPLAARALGVPRVVLDERHSNTYANAEVCRFTPPRRSTPYVQVFSGRPDTGEYETHASDPSRIDEPSLPGGAYSYIDGAAAAVVLRLTGGGELEVSVAGLADRAANRDAARRLAADVLRLAA